MFVNVLCGLAYIKPGESYSQAAQSASKERRKISLLPRRSSSTVFIVPEELAIAVETSKTQNNHCSEEANKNEVTCTVSNFKFFRPSTASTRVINIQLRSPTIIEIQLEWHRGTVVTLQQVTLQQVSL